MNYAQIINSPKYRRWTVGAAECYKRGGVCRGCETFELTSGQCRMKASVISLVKHYGPPPENIETRDFEIQERCIGKDKKDMIKINASGTKMFDTDINLEYGRTYGPIINAIKKGFTNNADIARETGIDKNYLSVKYRDFCTTLKSKGLINYPNEKTYLENIIDFIQKRLNKSETANIQNNHIEQFTSREQEIVDLLVNGLNYREVCNKLIITMATFKSHLNNIYSKRDYHTLQDLIVAESKNKTNDINIPVKRKTDADYIKELTDENKKLREEISELTKKINGQIPAIDFNKIREQINTEIEKLNAKLQALDLLEKELTP